MHNQYLEINELILKVTDELKKFPIQTIGFFLRSRVLLE